MNTTEDLVNALIDGNTMDIERTFNAAMSEKISSALDDYRITVAQNMFNTASKDSSD